MKHNDFSSPREADGEFKVDTFFSPKEVRVIPFLDPQSAKAGKKSCWILIILIQIDNISFLRSQCKDACFPRN